MWIRSCDLLNALHEYSKRKQQQEETYRNMNFYRVKF